MATGIDNVSSSNVPGSATSVTVSHATAGASRAMVVAVGTNGKTVTGITYAGIAMTSLGVSQEGPTGHLVALFGMVAPGTGTNNVIASFSGATPCVIGIITFTGVDQVNPFGTFASTSTTAGTTIQTLVVSDADNLVVSACIWNATVGAATGTADAPETQQWTQQGLSFVNGLGATQPGAAAVTCGYTLSVATNAALAAISVQPALTPAKGSISRVIVPLSAAREKRFAHVLDGWQQRPAFDDGQFTQKDFFTGHFLG